jgi:thioredoxin reductase (NADPH)
LRGERVLHERLSKKANVSILFDSVIDEIVGAEAPLSVTGAKIKNVKTGKVETVDADGVFIAIGHAPAAELFKGQVKLKGSGYIAVEPGTTRTNIKGVFAAGDVADEIYRQAVTAAGMGCMAALEVEKYLLDADA